MPTIHSHTRTMPDGSVVDVFKLHKILKDRAPIKLPITDILKPNKSKRTGFSKKRSEHADIAFPLIIDRNNFLIDGRHRYFKLVDKQVTTIQAVVAEQKDIKKATL